MSLLMDALRKAEQQKQQLAEQSGGDNVRRQDGGTQQSGLTLEPINRHPSLPDERPTTQENARLPDLPSSLEALDEQFLAHAASMRPEPIPFTRPEPTLERPAVQPARSPATPASDSSTAIPAQPLAAASTAVPSQTGAPAATAATTRAAASGDNAREAARQLFDAKHPGTGLDGATKGRNRHFALAMGLISLVAAIAIGGYFWWQLQPKNTGLLATLPARPAAPVTPVTPAALPTTVPAATPPATTQAIASPEPTSLPTSLPAPQTAAATTLPAALPAAPPAAVSPLMPAVGSMVAPTFAPPPAAPPPPAPMAATRTVPAVPATPVAAVTPAAASTPIQRTVTPPRIDPLLADAHAAYSRGDNDQAGAAWQQALAADPRNLDALRGLAVLAQRRQQLAAATHYFQRALEVNPKDAIALTGLMALQAPSNMQQAESRLKTLLAEQPEAATLHFALGNQLVRQQRWADAQQAYFKAYTIEPANPAYVFNLAVSLDQLHQTRLAVRYYNESIVAADRHPGQPAEFSRESVRVRLQQLEAAN